MCITGVCMCVLMFIVGTAGNALIIWTFASIKHLRVVQNIFIVCLAVVDFLIIGYLLPFIMYVMIINEAGLPVILCKINAVICQVLFACSLQLIMHISLSRYLKICHSKIFDRKFTTANCLLLVASGPIIGTIFSIVPPVWRYLIYIWQKASFVYVQQIR